MGFELEGEGKVENAEFAHSLAILADSLFSAEFVLRNGVVIMVGTRRERWIGGCSVSLSGSGHCCCCGG